VKEAAVAATLGESTAPRLVAFDLDDTLARSKCPIEPEMAAALTALLERHAVLVISGGNRTQFDTQVLAHLPDGPQLDSLHLMPTCGTRYLRREEHSWREVYAHDLDPLSRNAAFRALEDVARELGYWEPDDRVHGDRIEDRGSQVTFSALGQQAPPEAKKAWDPDGSRREAMRVRVAMLLPHLEVRSGGSTSIDVTSRGIDKAYGLGRLMGMLELAPEEVLFVGDRLEPGGNDHAVVALGVRTQPVRHEADTLAVIAALLGTGPAALPLL
jgi:HAD superfamily hydrolase (TIGR01484 family)